VINNLRAALGTSARQCAIMLDTKGEHSVEWVVDPDSRIRSRRACALNFAMCPGPEIRTGKLKGGLSTLPLTKDSTFVWHHDLDRQGSKLLSFVDETDSLLCWLLQMREQQQNTFALMKICQRVSSQVVASSLPRVC
jgi:hypothetical protein